MTDLLNKLKNSLIPKKKTKGHTLGGHPPSNQSGDDCIYTVQFHESSLGITVDAAPHTHPMAGSPRVLSVVNGSDAQKGGVRSGDIILSIESNEGTIQYGDFIEVIQALGRPLSLRFTRIPEQSIQMNNKGKKKPVPLTDEEKSAQREAMVNAAMNREKAWDKRVAAASTNRRKKNEANNVSTTQEPSAPQSAEVLRSIEAAKRSEERIAQAMGYNPFKPHISTKSSEVRNQIVTANVGSSITASSDSAPTVVSPPADVSLLESVYDEASLDTLGNALSEMRYTEDDDIESLQRKKVCVDTTIKMLSNIQNNPNEAKFRCIRLSNATFRKKVAEVEGGLELMLSAGFTLSEENEETYLKHDGIEISSLGGENNTSDMKLRYTLYRLQVVQQVISESGA